VAELKSAIDVYKLLAKSNCRECGMAACMAFAAAVFKGERALSGCPHLDKETLETYAAPERRQSDRAATQQADLNRLKEKIAEVDFPAAAAKLGATASETRLTVKCLGKNFSVDKDGNIATDIHVHGWITGPVYHYILHGAGTPVSGKWVPLRELPGGRKWYRLFGQRCEKPLKKVADTYTDLFEDMIHLFNGRQVENHYAADISLVLYPLPKVPILICYWRPEDGLESTLNIFFDTKVEENLNIESLYVLCTGLVIMFEKLSMRHG